MQPVDIDTAESLSKIILPARYSPRGIGVGQNEEFLYPYSLCCFVPLKLIKTSREDLGSFRCRTCSKFYFSPVGKFPDDYSAIEQIWIRDIKSSDIVAINNITKTISEWTLIDYSELEVEVK